MISIRLVTTYSGPKRDEGIVKEADLDDGSVKQLRRLNKRLITAAWSKCHDLWNGNKYQMLTVVIIVDGDTVDPLLLHQARVLQGLDDDGLDPLGDIVHSPLGVQLLLPVSTHPLPLAARS